MHNKEHWAFVEIADMNDTPNPLLPGYADKSNGEGEAPTPWTWQAWCDQPHKAATARGGRIFIGAATFALRSQRLTHDEYGALKQAGVVLISQDDLPAEDQADI